jgi:hypothetical protein
MRLRMTTVADMRFCSIHDPAIYDVQFGAGQYRIRRTGPVVQSRIVTEASHFHALGAPVRVPGQQLEGNRHEQQEQRVAARKQPALFLR